MTGKQKILIVDDRAENLVALRQVLRDENVELIEATNGNQALAATLDHQFAMAILDVQMPQMSGYELATYLRGDEKTKHTPIIFVTAYSADEQSIFAGYEAGGIDYIVKPYQPDILRGKVRLFLEMDRYRHELRQHRDHLENLVAQRTVALSQEIMDRRQAQERAEHLNSVLRSIRNINQLIVRAKEPAALIQEACDLLVETRGYLKAWIVLGSPESAVLGQALATHDSVSSPTAQPFDAEHWPHCWSKVQDSPQGITIIESRGSCDACPLQAQHAGGPAMVAQLRRGDNLMGLLGVALQPGMSMDEEEQSLLLEVAGDIAFALHDIRIERQHDLFAEIVANSQEAMSLVDREGRFLKINPAYERYIGAHADQVEGRLVDEVLDRDLLHKTLKPYLDRCLAGQEMSFETWRTLAEKGRRLIKASYSPCYGEDGSVYAAAVCLHDVTDLREAEESLRESEERYRTLIMQSADCLLLHDLEGNILDVNPSSCSTYGYSREELLSMKVSDLDPDYDQRNDRGSFYRRLRPGEPLGFEARQKTKTGRILPVEVRVSLIELGGKKLILSLSRDITERWEAQQALRRNERMLGFAIEQMPVPVIIVSAPKMKVERYNRLVLDFLERSQPDEQRIRFTNDLVFSAIHRPSGEPLRFKDLPLTQAIRQGHTIKDMELVVRQGGQDRWISASAAPLRDEDGNIIAGIVVFPETTSRKQAELEREKLEAAIEQSSDTVIITDAEGAIQYVNPAFERITGYSLDEVVGKNPRILKSGKQNESFYRELWAAISSGRAWQGQMENKRKDGSLFIEESRIFPVRDHSGALCNYVAIKTDISDRLKMHEERGHLEEQMRQAQKMESIGRLAGGVAHDFNNMLSIIAGYAEIAADKLEPGDPLRSDLDQILEAAMRSRDLTRQLLAFARRQTIAPQVVDLKELLGKSQSMLSRLIGEDIDLQLNTQPDLWPVKLDPSQIDQIVANLAVNARDAIKGVGTVIIETSNQVLNEDFCESHVEFSPGQYVLLTFSDTGAGMDRDTLKQIFEPFFTTKAAGKGTGLGLSTVYGIVRQAGGMITAYSEPGVGTTFKIYLPRCDETPGKIKSESNPKKLTGNETILVVEDEQLILDLCRQVLKRSGYNVIAAGQPGEALLLAEKHPGDIHLLITDVVMPSMNGKELKERIEGIKPGIKALYMSGYTANIIAHRGVLTEGVEFLQKPFATKELVTKVRHLLDLPS